MSPRSSLPLRFSMAVALLGALSGGLTLPAQAQLSTDLNFQAPPVGSPGNREAGVQRSDTCASVNEQAGLTALVPDTNVGLTTQAAPQLFAYIPTNNAEFAELRLIKESTGEEVYAAKAQMPTATTAGSTYSHQASILKLSLPMAVSLEPGENYLWALMLVCNDDNRAEDIVITAVVQRSDDEYLNSLPPEVSTELSTLDLANSDEKLITYSSAGLWQDLLAQLSTLVGEDPVTYEAVWSNLLADQGLGAVATAPIYESSLSQLTP